MRSLIIFVLALAAFAGATFAQAPDTAWTRTLNRPGEYITVAAASPMGTIVTAGWRSDMATWRTWSEHGAMLDSNLTIGYENGDTTVATLSAIAVCTDGSGDCIIAGGSRLQQSGMVPFAFAARVSWQGDVLWRQSYSFPNETVACVVESVVPRADGSAILFGSRFSGQCFAIGIAASGETLWSNSYPIEDQGFDAVQGACILGMPDGGALMSGFSFTADTFTVRIDAGGEIVWANQTQFSRALALHPDTTLCTMWYGQSPTLYVFKMTGSGDTLGTSAYAGRYCSKLMAEPNGGWSMVGTNGSESSWLGCFSSNGTLLWSSNYEMNLSRAIRLKHADYAFVDIVTNTVMKTESGPRGDPTNLTILPGWPDPNLALLGWKGAEWQFYQIYGSANPNGPFNQLLGGTDDTGFVVSIDSAAQFFRVVGVEQLE